MDTKPKYENTRGNLGNHFNEIDLWIGTRFVALGVVR